MKRLALVAAVLTLAACTTKETKTETTDSAAMMAPAPAPEAPASAPAAAPGDQVPVAPISPSSS